MKKTVEKIVPVMKQLLNSTSLFAQSIGLELNEKLPPMSRVTNVAERNLRGEKVPATEKTLSIFEPHTELIMRGRREKPVEFGHKILLSECPQKFITDYHVFAQSPSESGLIPMVLERQEETFGKKPKTLAADMGFCPTADDLRDEVEYLAVPSRLRDLGDSLPSTWQKFRVGIEGTISCLKRVYRLSQCHFRGFNVFCHNLIVMAVRLSLANLAEIIDFNEKQRQRCSVYFCADAVKTGLKREFPPPEIHVPLDGTRPKPKNQNFDVVSTETNYRKKRCVTPIPLPILPSAPTARDNAG